MRTPSCSRRRSVLLACPAAFALTCTVCSLRDRAQNAPLVDAFATPTYADRSPRAYVWCCGAQMTEESEVRAMLTVSASLLVALCAATCFFPVGVLPCYHPHCPSPIPFHWLPCSAHNTAAACHCCPCLGPLTDHDLLCSCCPCRLVKVMGHYGWKRAAFIFHVGSTSTLCLRSLWSILGVVVCLVSIVSFCSQTRCVVAAVGGCGLLSRCSASCCRRFAAPSALLGCLRVPLAFV
jgi:hypothetical protein